MLDDRVRSVLARLDAEHECEQREEELPPAQRSLAVGPEAGRLLFALVAPHRGCRVLEIGGSRGYSAIWLAAAARIRGGSVLSLESDPAKCEAWRRNVADAGLEAWAELVEGDALASLARVGGSFDVVFVDAWKVDYETYFGLARARLEPGGVVVADNVVSHAAELGVYVTARQADSALSSVTVPVGHGLEVTVVLS